LKGSFFLLIGYNLFNIFNFLFQFFLAYTLTKEEYGVFAALLPFIYILGSIGDGVQTITAVKVAKNKNKKGISKRGTKLIFIIGFLFLLLMIGSASSISESLKTSSEGVIIVGILGISTLFLAAARGVLQGAHQFKVLMVSLIGEAGTKLFLVYALFALFVFIDRSFLALVSILLASGITLGIIFWMKKPFFMEGNSSTKKGFPSIELFSLLVSLAIIGCYSIDLIIARLILPEAIATEYAYLALIGKTILWGILPISKAMLPLVVKQETPKANETFKKTILYTTLLGIIGVVLFATFPEYITTIFTGKSLLFADQALSKIALAMFLLSLANIFLLFGAARVVAKKRNVCLLTAFLLFFWIFEAIMLYYGGTSLERFVNLFLVIATSFSVASYFFMKKIIQF